VLTIIDDRKAALQDSIKLLQRLLHCRWRVGVTGPFFKAYLSNLLPGQFMQPFVDAAFSDLGLDPATLSPRSVLIRRPASRPLRHFRALPANRAGRRTETHLPDAITGKPDDPRYPYREPPPQAAARWSPTWSTRAPDPGPAERTTEALPPDGGNQ